MPNHLNLRHTLFELSAQGDLSIFSAGKSVVLSATEVQQMSTWLRQEQPEQRLALEAKQIDRGQLGGLRIRQGNTALIIPADEVQPMLHWLKRRG